MGGGGVLPGCRHGDQARVADLGQIIDEGRVLPCTGGRMSFFDSLVTDLPPTPRLWRPGVFGQVRDE
jgi:hypothetical protein